MNCATLACTAAATVAVAYALGCEFEDCRLDDDGRRCPVSLSVVEIKYPDGWRGKDDFVHVAMIHEAGAIAVAKSHGRSPHINTEDSDELFHNSLVPDASFSTEASGFPNHFHNPEFMAALRTSRTAVLLDIPLIWNVVKALAEFIRNNDEAEGSYGALGTDCAGGARRRGQRGDQADEGNGPHARLALVRGTDRAA